MRKYLQGLLHVKKFLFSEKVLPPNIDSSSCIKSFFDSLSTSNLSFNINVGPSSLSNAGNGVMLSGRLSKYQLVSFYPGFYFPPPPIHAIGNSDGEICLKPSEISREKSIYRIGCPNMGGAVDSVGFDRSLLPFYCSGDIVNHPPKGRLPNVFPIDFSWKKLWDDSEQWDPRSRKMLQYYMERVNKRGSGIWYIDGSTLEPVYLPEYDKTADVGIAIVSLCSINNSTELLMDYQFNPAEPLPEWYSPVDYTQKERKMGDLEETSFSKNSGYHRNGNAIGI